MSKDYRKRPNNSTYRCMAGWLHLLGRTHGPETFQTELWQGKGKCGNTGSCGMSAMPERAAGSEIVVHAASLPIDPGKKSWKNHETNAENRSIDHEAWLLLILSVMFLLTGTLRSQTMQNMQAKNRKLRKDLPYCRTRSNNFDDAKARLHHYRLAQGLLSTGAGTDPGIERTGALHQDILEKNRRNKNKGKRWLRTCEDLLQQTPSHRIKAVGYAYYQRKCCTKHFAGGDIFAVMAIICVNRTKIRRAANPFAGRRSKAGFPAAGKKRCQGWTGPGDQPDEEDQQNLNQEEYLARLQRGRKTSESRGCKTHKEQQKRTMGNSEARWLP